MIRKTLFAFIFLLSSLSVAYSQEVPDQLEYCGITCKLTPGAKAKLQAYINAIYESPRFFNTMVEKADTYMPFIEEAFADANLPQDLKYLVIQESSLKADAVSDSDAVGYWQFKLDPALEYGLQINEMVDERQHIFRASQAAAQYFHKANYDFDNWVYAVIAYYEGLTGAVRYTDPVYYSKTEMVITEKLHWYVMKAIAHKLAYEVALNMKRAPRVWLEPKSTGGEPQIAAICAANNLPPELFFEYNKWAINRVVLPEGNSLTYYIPHFSEPYAGHVQDPNKQSLVTEKQEQFQTLPDPLLSEQEPVIQPSQDSMFIAAEDTKKADSLLADLPIPEVPEISESTSPSKRILQGEAMDISEDPDMDHALFYTKADLNYGEDFILVEAGASLGQIAKQYKVPLGRLASWNGFRGGQIPQPGTYLYLQKPEKVDFHIVSEGETINQIAAFRKTSTKSIYKKNRYARDQRDIYIGQKLYLGKKKPKGEKIIILKQDNPFVEQEDALEIPVSTNDKAGMSAPREEKVRHESNLPNELESAPRINIEPKPAPKATPSMGEAEANEEADLPPRDYSGPRTRWVDHTVSAGETLWSISVTYGTKVEIIKLINKMPNDSLSEGMTLRILAKEDKLKDLGIE